MEGTPIFFLSLVQQKVYKKVKLHTSTQTAGPVRRLPDITLLDMMTFVVVALQTGHKFKDTLHDHRL